MKNIYRIIFLLILNSAFSTHNSFSQQITFQKTFRYPSSYLAIVDFVQINDHYTLCGQKNNAASDHSFFISSVDSLGQVLWAKEIGNSNLHFTTSFQECTGNNYIVCGSAFVTVNNSYDLFLTYLDSSGNVIWSKTFGGIYNEQGQFAKQSSDGGIIACGNVDENGISKIFVVKTDINGNLQWTKVISSQTVNENCFAYNIQSTLNSGFILCGGNSILLTFPQSDGLLINLDSTGTIVWAKSFGLPEADCFWSLLRANDGGYIIGGWTDPVWDSIFERKFLLLRTDSMGNFQWAKYYGGNEDDFALKVSPTNDNGFILLGRTMSDDFFVVKTDSSGVLLWPKKYGSASYEEASSIIQTADGGYLIGGTTSGFGSQWGDAYLIKTDFNGSSYCSEWNPSTPFSSVVMPQYNLALSQAANDTTYTDSLNSSSIIFNEHLICFSTYKNELSNTSFGLAYSPNPLTTQSKLTFKNTNKEKFLFTLYDITGRVTESVSTTTNEIILTKGSKPAGVYLFNLMNEKTGERWNGKIVVSD